MQKPAPIGTQMAGASPPPAPPPRGAASASAPDVLPPELPHESPVRPEQMQYQVAAGAGASPPPPPPNSFDNDMSSERPDLTKGQVAAIRKEIFENLPRNERYGTWKRFLAGAPVQANPQNQNISYSLLQKFMENPEAFRARHGVVPEPDQPSTPQMQFGTQLHGLVDAYLAGRFDPERPEAFDPALKGFATDPGYADLRTQFEKFRNFSKYFKVLGHETRLEAKGMKADALGLAPEKDPSGREMPVNVVGQADLIVQFNDDAGPELAGKIANIDIKTSHFTPKDEKDMLERSLTYMPQHVIYQFLHKFAKTPDELATIEKMENRKLNVEVHAVYLPHLGKLVYYYPEQLEKLYNIRYKAAIQAMYKTLAGMQNIEGLPPQYEEAKKAKRARGVYYSRRRF